MVEDLPEVRFCRNCENCASSLICYSLLPNETYRIVRFCAEDTPSGQLDKIMYDIEDSLTEGAPCNSETMDWLGLKLGAHPFDSPRYRRDPGSTVCDAWEEQVE